MRPSIAGIRRDLLIIRGVEVGKKGTNRGESSRAEYGQCSVVASECVSNLSWPKRSGQSARSTPAVDALGKSLYSSVIWHNVEQI